MKVLKWLGSLIIGLGLFSICIFIFQGFAFWVANLSFLGFLFINSIVGPIVWFFIFSSIYGTAFSISYTVLLALPFNRIPPHKTFNVVLAIYFVLFGYATYQSNSAFVWPVMVPVIIMVIWCIAMILIVRPTEKQIKKDYKAFLKKNPFSAECIGMENPYNNKIINSKRDYFEYANSYVEDLNEQSNRQY